MVTARRGDCLQLDSLIIIIAEDTAAMKIQNPSRGEGIVRRQWGGPHLLVLVLVLHSIHESSSELASYLIVHYVLVIWVE